MDQKHQTTLLAMVYGIPNNTRTTIAAKILKKLSDRSFIAADSSGHCTLKISQSRPTLPDNLMTEGRCLKFHDVWKYQDTKILIFDDSSTVQEHGPIKDIECEVCLGCNDVVYGDDGLFDHLANSKPCKATYEAGNGWTISLKKFFKNCDTNDALRVKIIAQISSEMYEAGDASGICKLTVHPDNPKKELVKVHQSIAILTPRCMDSAQKIVHIGKACHVSTSPGIKIPIHIYNENIQKPPEEVSN